MLSKVQMSSLRSEMFCSRKEKKLRAVKFAHWCFVKINLKDYQIMQCRLMSVELRNVAEIPCNVCDHRSVPIILLLILVNKRKEFRFNADECFVYLLRLILKLHLIWVELLDKVEMCFKEPTIGARGLAWSVSFSSWAAGEEKAKLSADNNLVSTSYADVWLSS